MADVAQPFAVIAKVKRDNTQLRNELATSDRELALFRSALTEAMLIREQALQLYARIASLARTQKVSDELLREIDKLPRLSARHLDVVEKFAQALSVVIAVTL